IPTYPQETIAAFAHVFTGWNLDTQIAPGVANYRDPMVVPNANNHDPNPQTLFGGTVVSGLAVPELGGRNHGAGNNALDNVFDHHNVGPFMGKQLIQKLVTSNPSPQYVGRVTVAFNSGRYQGQTLSFGSGQRGDMQATIAAVLLDAEARGISTDAV